MATSPDPRTRPQVRPLPEPPVPFEDGTIAVVPWPADEPGHDPRTAYAERFWTPVLGPSTLLLHRWLVDRLDDEPEGTLIDLDEAAARLGLGDRSTRHSPLGRTLLRLVRFRLAEARGPGVLAVRGVVPPLSPRALHQLPVALQAEHASFVEASRRLVVSPVPVGVAGAPSAQAG